MEAIGKLLEQLGYAAPVLYAGIAYGLFYWLDENLSDAAKAALASTMKFKTYGNEQVASALAEVFDRIYTSPLLSWRAFVRSLLFTTVVSVIYVFELYHVIPSISFRLVALEFWSIALVFNVFTDYLSLFVIRSSLIRSGTKPVIGLALATMSGAAIVLLANVLREIALFSVPHTLQGWEWWFRGFLIVSIPGLSAHTITLPAMIVFIWLPLFALGILVIRALTPLSWIVAKTQWALKEGDQHPLKAIGCVAAAVVFAIAVGLRALVTA
jgi:hypothetical protein